MLNPSARTPLPCHSSAVLLALCLFAGLIPRAHAVQIVELWSYHDYPPFIIDKAAKTGFSYGLAGILNDYSQGDFRFVVRTAPRRRIEHWLDGGGQGVVLWVNPSWFGDMAQKKYQWSAALLSDVSEVISLKEKAVIYRGPASLAKLRFGALMGETYPSLEKMSQGGELFRDDVASPHMNLRKLLRGRLDFTIMPRSEFVYLVHDSDVIENLYISPVPFQRFTRHLLIQIKNPELQKLFDFFEEHIVVDRNWVDLRRRYYLQ